MSKKKILVTQPLLPPLENLLSQLEDIWASGWVTNMGNKHNELEHKLTEELDVPYFSLFCNGTMALSTALKALDLPQGSEVITTAFTFAATPHCISWNGLKPVFCDIKADDFTIDPDKIEKLITEKTSAILGVHVYGFPCNVEKIQKIADKYNLKVIYDAAHAFSTKVNDIAIGNFGDITMFSFHATKLYNTIEGGGVTFRDSKLLKKIRLLRNFGIGAEDVVEEVGFNGKMNELQAVVGLENLKHYKEEQERRRRIKELYDDALKEVKGIKIPQMPIGVTNSYQYYPVVIEEDYPLTRDELFDKFKTADIFPRKYFFPSCTDYKCYRSSLSSAEMDMPVVNGLKNKVLCLPFYGALGKDELQSICNIIIEGN